jgi:hypothetical protein
MVRQQQAARGKQGRRQRMLAACRLPLAAISLSLLSCRPPTPADHTRNLRVELEVVRLGCAAYTLKKELPRESVLDRDCPSLLAPNGGVTP